jgi:hypothetical protein
MIRSSPVASHPMTIEQHQVMPLLLNACPSFRDTWEASVKRSDSAQLYISLGEFARHLRELYILDTIDEFPAVATVIENLHVNGSPYVKEAASVGLLENIQNSWRNSHIDPEIFAKYLHPESAKWWHSLNNFWDE